MCSLTDGKSVTDRWHIYIFINLHTHYNTLCYTTLHYNYHKQAYCPLISAAATWLPSASGSYQLGSAPSQSLQLLWKLLSSPSQSSPYCSCCSWVSTFILSCQLSVPHCTWSLTAVYFKVMTCWTFTHLAFCQCILAFCQFYAVYLVWSSSNQSSVKLRKYLVTCGDPSFFF